MDEKYISIFEIPNKALWNIEPKNRFVLPPENAPILSVRVEKKGIFKKNERILQMFNDSLVLFDVSCNYSELLKHEIQKSIILRKCINDS